MKENKRRSSFLDVSPLSPLPLISVGRLLARSGLPKDYDALRTKKKEALGAEIG